MDGGALNDPDIVFYTDELVTGHPDEDMEDPDTEMDSPLSDVDNLSRGKYLGYSIKDKEILTEDLQQDIVDIGIKYTARGRIFNEEDFSENDYISIYRKPNINKILRITDTKSFDELTDSYGQYERKNMYIKWNTLSNKYRGIYITESVIGNREDVIPFKDTTIDSWINKDYLYLNEVVIFKKQRLAKFTKKITKPFKGYIYDTYAINESEFTKLNHKNKSKYKDSILMIDTIRSFDQFTNKYGYIKDNKIHMKWHLISKDYDGFCIDKNNDFIIRYKTAYYKGKKYISWWKNNKITDEVVYIFD